MLVKCARLLQTLLIKVRIYAAALYYSLAVVFGFAMADEENFFYGQVLLFILEMPE